LLMAQFLGQLLRLLDNLLRFDGELIKVHKAIFYWVRYLLSKV
jgi:hypothetical protein